MTAMLPGLSDPIRVLTLDRPLAPEETAELAAASGTSRSVLLEIRVRIPTVDRRLSAVLEPKGVAPARRFAALRALRRAGLTAGVLVAPLVPGIDDLERDLVELVARARSCGASFLAYEIESPDARRRTELLRLLRQRYPRVAARYEVHLATASLPPDREAERASAVVASLARRFGIALRPPTGQFGAIRRPARLASEPGGQHRFAFAS
jgi:hypothetical protein